MNRPSHRFNPPEELLFWVFSGIFRGFFVGDSAAWGAPIRRGRASPLRVATGGDASRGPVPRWLFRELVKALFVQGFTPTQIARKTGLNADTVSTWSKRGNWTALRSKTCESLSQPLERLAALTIAERSARVRSELADELGESVGALRQTPAKPELQHLNQRAEVAGKLASSASKVFGWEGDGETPLVIVGEMCRAVELQAEVTTQPVGDQPKQLPPS